MVARRKENADGFSDLAPNQPYFVIGIEADDFRILNDNGKPYLYPFGIFDVVDSREPGSWVTEFGEDGERYAYPPILKEPGFFEDFFDGKEAARSTFWRVINARLSEAA